MTLLRVGQLYKYDFKIYVYKYKSSAYIALSNVLYLCLNSKKYELLETKQNVNNLIRK